VERVAEGFVRVKHDSMERTSSKITLVAPSAGMFDKWFTLYARYATDLGTPVDRRTAETVWRWLLDGTHRVAGVFAFGDRNELAGLAHYRPFPRTLNGNEACFLDDLYVAESYRRRGVARQLVERVNAIARQRGWTEIRWVTQPENEAARALYEAIAERSDLITYRMRA